VAVKLRLMRMGKKKQPTYRVVAADSRSPRDGRFIEIVGIYDPRPDPSAIRIDNDKAVDWLRKGAQPTESVRKLLEISGAWATFSGQPSSPPAREAAPTPAAKPTGESAAAKSTAKKATAKSTAKKAAAKSETEAEAGEAEAEDAPEPVVDDEAETEADVEPTAEADVTTDARAEESE
jgi:small subunit ribosomal protein S16